MNFRGVEKYSGGLRIFQGVLHFFWGGGGLMFFHDGLGFFGGVEIQFDCLRLFQ